MEEAIKQKVRGLVARIMRVDAATLDDAASPATVAGWDSLQHMKLVLALEEEFAVALSEDQIVDMITVSRIFAVLDESLSEA